MSGFKPFYLYSPLGVVKLKNLFEWAFLMKTETFPPEVAEIYDDVMNYFDYSKSAELIDTLITHKGSKRRKTSILEVGIGTGSLARCLGNRGYEVWGVDHSPGMMEKAVSKGIYSSRLQLSDVMDFTLDQRFNAVISHADPLRLGYTAKRGHFFETYLSNEEQIMRAVNNIAKHIDSQGLLILSAQTSPGREYRLNSTPQKRDLGNG